MLSEGLIDKELQHCNNSKSETRLEIFDLADFKFVRNVPEVDHAGYGDRATIYGDAIARFAEKFKPCPKCLGEGNTYKSKKEPTEENIKIDHIHDLDSSNKDKMVIPISTYIRDALSYEIEGRRPCSKCLGQRYIERKKTT